MWVEGNGKTKTATAAAWPGAVQQSVQEESVVSTWSNQHSQLTDDHAGEAVAESVLRYT